MAATGRARSPRSDQREPHLPLARYIKDGGVSLGKVFGDMPIDLTLAAPDLPRDVAGFLAAGAAARARYDRVTPSSGAPVPLAAVTLLAPVPRPEKFLAIGMNYADHSAEAERLGIAVPKFQPWFNKQVSCINDPFAGIVLPRVSEKLEYEAELAVVIGCTCHRITPEQAPACVGGYMICNDVSARHRPLRTPTMTLGKSFDTHGPTGPWLTLPDEIGDPHALTLRTLVNGEQRQNGNTRDLIFNIWAQISCLSQVITLRPGDILAPGTPAGAGAAMEPPRFLAVGDVVRIEIDGLGHIESRVIKDPH